MKIQCAKSADQGKEHAGRRDRHRAKYGGIIMLDRPLHDGDLFSRWYPAMTRLNSAKTFAPFAALAAFDERVRRKEITYVPKVELDADEEWELNRRLVILHERTANSKLAWMNATDIKVEYYAVCTDRENDAYMEKGAASDCNRQVGKG